MMIIIHNNSKRISFQREMPKCTVATSGAVLTVAVGVSWLLRLDKWSDTTLVLYAYHYEHGQQNNSTYS